MPEVTPQGAFDMLFRRNVGAEANEQARWKRSVLDSVFKEAATLQKRGTALDRQKVGEYLESVRSVERRIQATLQAPRKGWQPPTHPSESEFRQPPPGVPADRPEHVRQLLDILALALWTDSTRVATFMFANPLSEADFRFWASEQNFPSVLESGLSY